MRRSPFVLELRLDNTKALFIKEKVNKLNLIKIYTLGARTQEMKE
jgi:hypothetical protein